ncbi:Hypothetical protein A7982_04819 [Minicystis rosea]|nr:Hypothetical protein A7982_04819 [Minicystis rosea]
MTMLRRCSCGAEYGAALWGALALAQRITPSEIRLFVRDWPDQCFIEVRACARCGNLMTCKSERREVARDGGR